MDKLWLKRGEAHILVDMKDKAFRANIQGVLTEDEVRESTGRGKALKFWAPAIVRRLVAMAGESAAEPELAGEDSPALERFREARAALAEYELQIKQGDLMARADVHEGLVEAGVILQRKAVLLRKKFGEEAAQIIADATEDMLRTNERLFGSDDDSSSQRQTGQG